MDCLIIATTIYIRILHTHIQSITYIHMPVSMKGERGIWRGKRSGWEECQKNEGTVGERGENEWDGKKDGVWRTGWKRDRKEDTGSKKRRMGGREGKQRVVRGAIREGNVKKTKARRRENEMKISLKNSFYIRKNYILYLSCSCCDYSWRESVYHPQKTSTRSYRKVHGCFYLSTQWYPVTTSVWNVSFKLPSCWLNYNVKFNYIELKMLSDLYYLRQTLLFLLIVHAIQGTMVTRLEVYWMSF